MIVPQFWAESRLQHREKDRQVTIRRFGWSDTSPADAQANADTRVKEALDRILAGERLPRKDPKTPYNGAMGVPIREEIISRHGETIITRNSYGARCLNTPNVLFADIDFAEKPSFWFTLAIFVALIFVAAVVAWQTNSRGIGIAMGVLALFLLHMLSNAAFNALQTIKGGAKQTAQKSIAKFLARHPEWNLRLYRTPAGMRIVAAHKLFSPNEAAVADFFRALSADPLYVSMCLNQNCFRARVSAKPWRIGIQNHMRPRPGVWPVAADRLPMRNSWIEEYEKACSSYAACSFLETLGSGAMHPAAQEVIELHDRLCSANSKLPIA